VSEPETINPYEPPLEVNDAAPLPGPTTTLLASRSFWGMTLTQFLGAFNDNVYKTTLMLLFVAVPTGVDAAGEAQTRDLQGEGTFLFALPFILFSGLAGYLSDRFNKRTVILLCKIAEVGIMAAGLGLFLFYGRGPMSFTMVAIFSVVLFLMGTHSAFFGPGKYGILPELFRERDLPPANGIILMTTFLAIIFGVALAGKLKEWFEGELWVIGVICIGIALLGVGSALLVRSTPAVNPQLRFHWDMLLVPKDMRAVLAKDVDLNLAVWMYSVFWMAAAIVQSAVISLGKLQLDVGDSYTTILVSMISIGIVIGSPLAGFISRGRFHTGVLKVGTWGLTLCLVLMALPGGPKRQLLGYVGSVICLVALGIFTGLYAVPLQVFMQMRPPRELKGRMIATMNLLNFLGITLAGLLYAGISRLFEAFGWPPSAMFAVTAVMFGAVAVFYRPREVPLHK
jgi:acyl-[acyl-carrier-protein]-phospholipid O-acyltransferase/long-chain-fatty-acid--[acyl-carrier-protein] ligase